ncbi:MAG TPA: copper chaperone PCu(A)C [Nitrospirota bacterium]|nr:copper chaperone PCu(A)C [Nitrospirota bacterium]
MQQVSRREKVKPVAFIVLAAVAMLSAACRSSPPQISIEAARAELSGAVIGEAMVTMSIKNQGGPDVLAGVKADVPGAKAAFHTMQGERMVEVDSMNIPAKSTVELRLPGSHIMISDMPKTMVTGSPISVILTFQKSGEKRIALTLQAAPAMPMGHMHHM